MSRSRLIIIIIIAVLFVAAVILVVLSYLNQREENQVILPPVQQQNQQNNLPLDNFAENDDIKQRENFITSQLTEKEKQENFLIKTASSFAESFGSYSNQSNYENLIDLKPLMTSKMKSWADDRIMAGLNKQTPQVYYGITTRALNAQLIEMNESRAKVSVGTQRQESVGDEINSKVTYSDILIVFEREGGVWKVAGAFWQ